jgi:uncharacterized SAM-binding protein YcdF (DUF218 family)
LSRAGAGLLIGTFCGLAADQLGILGLLHIEDPLLVPAVLGAILLNTRARAILWLIAAFLLTLLFVVGCTPLVRRLMPTLEIRDRLQPAQAVVVLSASTERDGSLGGRAQERVLHAFELLRQDYAPRLVLTNATVPFGSQVPTVLRQMQVLGMNYPVDQTGPVADTHDEALEVARLARRYRWSRLILVTQPWHMRRAAATFAGAGLHVQCSPCVEGDYDLHSLDTPAGRLRAFRDWLHEAVGYQVYRKRGWIR